MHRRPLWSRFVTAGLSAAMLAACGNGFSPSVDTVSGPYTASELTLKSGTQTTDLLAAGASLTLTLLGENATGGTAGGRLFVPGGDEDGSDLDLSLEGTWSLAGDKVTLEHEADSFLRDLPLIVSENRLVGSVSQGGTTIFVVLTKPGSND
jgi:hypothetical protein